MPTKTEMKCHIITGGHSTFALKNSKKMIQIKCTQITYEALGRVQVTYSECSDIVYILDIIRLIADTAHVSDLRNVVIDKAVYKENNLGDIEKWYEKVKYVEK